MKIFQDISRLAAGFLAKHISGETRAWLTGADEIVSVPRLRSPFAGSAAVHAAVRHVAGPVAGLRLEFTAKRVAARRRAMGGPDEVVQDPLLEAFWDAPAYGLATLSEFVEASVTWRLLAGECFWLMGDEALKPFPEAGGRIGKLILARPDRMRHVVDRAAPGMAPRLEGWEYTDGLARRHALLPEQVIHLKRFNPYDDFRGLGDLEACRIAAQADFNAGNFVRALMESNGDQGVYVVAKSGIVGDEQRNQIVAQLREKRALQQRGIFKPLFLTGDITIEDPKVRAVDVAFIETRRMLAEEIFIAFHVPPSMASKAQSYSIGSASDYYRLILDACMPESVAIARGITQVSRLITRREQLWAGFCWDEHPVLQETRKERLDAAEKLWSKGMPMALVSAYLDLGLPRFEGDDVGYLPFSVQPAMAPAAGTEELAAAASEPPEEAPRMMEMEERAGATDFWKRQIARRRETANRYRSAFNRHLMAARAEVLSKIEAKKNGPPAVTRAGAADFMFDAEKFKKAVKASFRKVSIWALEDAMKSVAEEVGYDDPMTMPQKEVTDFIAARENRISDATDAVFERIKGALSEGLTAGDPMDEIASRVKDEFNDISRGRATTIAMTETAAAFGTGRQAGMAKAGVQYKKWVTSHAENVRAAHRAAEGQIVAVDEPFIVGGEDLMFPGDPNGSPENVINCHCVAVATKEPPE